MIKLSARDVKVLAAIQHRANVSAAEIGREVRMKPHVVRAAIRSLTARELISPAAVVNTALLGWQPFDLHFSMACGSSKKRQSIERYLAESDIVSMFMELEGDYEYSLKFWGRQPGEAIDFLDRLAVQFGEVFQRRSMAIEYAYIGFGRRYLDRSVSITPLAFSSAPKILKGDEIDFRILRRVTQAPIPGLAALAKAAGVPLSTAEYRLKALEKAGIIVGYAHRIATERLGYQRYRMLLEMRSVSRALRRSVVQFCERETSVFNLLCTMGAWDFDIGVEVQAHSELRAVVRLLNDTFGDHLIRARVMPVYRYIKLNSFPFASKRAS